MQAYFRLNNSILDCGLTPNELKVAVCLYSCVFNNRCVVQIKQATIAQKCGIKKIETVANIICQLQRKGIIERVSRPHKANGQLGTYIYKLKAIVSKGHFKIKRYILGKLNGVQLRMYLFVCRAITKKNDMWNSFNDISRALQIGRHLIEGLWDGIKSMGSWLGDRCRDFGNAWVSGFKTIFGIHSPSTLFRDEIGKNLALGLGVGFTDNMEKVRRDMQKALPTSFDIDPQMTVSSVSQLGAGLSEEAAKANEQVVFYMNIGSFTNRSDRDIDELMEYAGNRFASQMERRSRVF